MYREALVPVPKNWSSFEYFYSLLSDLDLASSPGYPYMRTAPTIGKWLEADGDGGFSDLKVQMLWYDVQQVMSGHYDHVFRAFIKDEPHKVAKAQSNRWRLIMASALPVQMVWRMLYSHQNKSLNESPYKTPSKHGLVFCYGGWRRFLSMCKSQGIKYSRDISAWDVNAPGWVFRVIRDFRARMGGADSQWLIVHDLLYDDAYCNSQILFSNGIIVKQFFEGVMKSGLFSTISDNSLAMVAMHLLACFRTGTQIGNIAATGDDVVQSIVNDSYLQALEDLGCNVKEVHPHLEFMGMDYTSGKPEPLYFQKHVFNFTCKSGYEGEVIDAYLRMYSHSDLFDFWKRVAELGKYRHHSRFYYNFWYDSPLAAIYKSLK